MGIRVIVRSGWSGEKPGLWRRLSRQLAAVYYEQEVASWKGLDAVCWILGNR